MGNGKRDSGIELLRIVCMFLIIIYHFNLHTDFSDVYDPHSVSFLIHIFCLNWGETAVLAFVMITGYYSVTQSFKTRRILYIMLETLFYSVVITLSATACGIIEFNDIYCIQMLFPITSASYWFVTYYIVLMLLSPFINIILNRLTKIQYLILLTVLAYLTICFRIIPVTPMVFGSYFISFVLAYSIAGIFRLFPSDEKIRRNKGLCLILFSVIFIAFFDWFVINNYYGDTSEGRYGYWPLFVIMSISFVSFIIILFSNKIGDKAKVLSLLIIPLYCASLFAVAYVRGWDIISDFRRPDCGFCMISAVGLFLFFKNLRPFYNGCINWISASVLSVYLVHDSNPLRWWIWNDVVCANDILQSSVFYYIGVMLIWAIAIFSVCIIADKIKNYLLFDHLDVFIERVSSQIDSIIGNFDENGR